MIADAERQILDVQQQAATDLAAQGRSSVGVETVALAEAACRQGLRALFIRVPRIVEELAIARVSGAYASMLAKISRIEVVVLDDFLLAPMKDAERRDLLERPLLSPTSRTTQ